jgi:hypothetical protein
MAAPTVTYTFANASTADATEVNQNFTDIINALTDTTSDLSFSTLTLASTATITGAVTLSSNTVDIGQSLRHIGDTGTLIGFTSGQIDILADSVTMITCIEAATDEVVINEGGADVDFRIESDTDISAFYFNGANGRIGLSDANPASAFHIEDDAGGTDMGYITMEELSGDAAAPAANRGVIYMKDSGGKTALYARFPSGAVQQIAVEP